VLEPFGVISMVRTGAIAMPRAGVVDPTLTVKNAI
jgi:acetolactate synthase small subunit